MMGELRSENRSREVKLQKSYFDVLGLCCSSEVPLIEKILQPLEGIQKVSVIVPSRTVIVVHDTALISQLQIAKALNQARLEATIRTYGSDTIVKRWPSPYILACGMLLLVSSFKSFFRPLQWFAVVAIVVGMPPIVMRSIAAVQRYTLDINILMLIAVGGAVALRDYSEAGFIVFLFTIAEWLESRASHKATAGMSSLMSMAPQKATLAGTGEAIDAADVMIDTVLAVKAGEVIPIDSIVVEGRSEVDESSLTGESLPVAKQAESLVWAGTLNLDGYISVRTTALAEHSAVANMARLVEEAQNSRSKTQRLIDSCAKYYTPAVVVIAAGIAVIPLMLRVRNPKHWFQLALVLLVSACPCALVLSTPVATFCALLKAARTGILVKGGDVLEALAGTRVVAFDKTGTITMGEFTVMEFRSISSEVSVDELLYWVSSIECKSSHPMASALVGYARLNSIEPKPESVSEFQILPGEGIHGEIDGKNIYVGNKRIATRAGCATVPNLEETKEAVTVGYVFSGSTPVGIFTLSDTCRTGVAEAIRELKALGVKTAMLTGDSTAAAKHAQNQLGNAIEILHAELLPEDKVRIISDLKTKEGSTTMVGDGLNDAPALAMANVGISMGISGSAVAMETSHITLMSNDIRKIPKAIWLARKTHRTIIVNIFFSLITKIAILALAIAGHPLLWAAVLADVGTCLLVILNSMMLLQTRTTKEKKRCGSSHKSKAHKQSCHDHGTAEEGKVCKHSCHDHETAEEGKVYKHSCHDHETAEQGKVYKHCCHDHETAEEGRASKPSCHDHETAEGRRASKPSCHDHKTAEDRRASKPSCHDHEAEEEARGCKHNCHDHEIAEEGRAYRHSCHDNWTAEEGRAHDNCSSSSKKGDCHMKSPNISNYDPKPIKHTTKSSHEHLISITSEAEYHRDGLHKDHAGGHTVCCHIPDVAKDCNSNVTCGNQPSGSNTTCRSSHMNRTTEKKEMGECCRSEKKECWSKAACTSKGEIVACGTSYANKDCCMDSQNHSHCDPVLVKDLTNASHKHLISTTSGAEYQRDWMHEEHHGAHTACCHKSDVGKVYESNVTTCMNKEEIAGCGRTYRKECGRKDGCCGSGLVPLHEIITE